MATTDRTTGTRSEYPAQSGYPCYVLSNSLSTATYNQASGDIAQVLTIPAKTHVLAVSYEVTTAEGGTLTFDVGDGADTDGWIDGANGNSAAAGGVVATEAYQAINGKFYASADTIDVLFNNAADAAVIEVRAVCVEMS